MIPESSTCPHAQALHCNRVIIFHALRPSHPPNFKNRFPSLKSGCFCRYVDLIVTGGVRDTFRSRAKMNSTIRRVLEGKGFLEVETPVLEASAGGADAKPFVTYHNALEQKYALRIATYVIPSIKFPTLDSPGRAAFPSEHRSLNVFVPLQTVVQRHESRFDCRGNRPTV